MAYACASSSAIGVPSAAGDERPSRRVRGSVQLQRWARARRSRRPHNDTNEQQPQQQQRRAVVATVDKEQEHEYESSDSDGDGEEDEEGGRRIFMVSDGTGWTVDHSVQAALGQFEHCLVDRGCAVSTHLFSEVSDVDRLMEVVRQAAVEGAILVYTLADPSMAEAARAACKLLGVTELDILGPITETLGSHLRVAPLGQPRGLGIGRTLSRQYLKRIAAVDFTIKQDDGALPQNLHKADVVLAGVSRTSKTPLSTYMAHMGYKVANVPLVLGIPPPPELLALEQQDKVYGLTIDHTFLRSIRAARYRHLGLDKGSRSHYFDMDHIRAELQYSADIFKSNPTWPVIEVTGRAIEETAAVILRIYHERKNKYAIPRISKRY